MDPETQYLGRERTADERPVQPEDEISTFLMKYFGAYKGI